MATPELTKKQFIFKGKTIEELKALSVREFASFINSRSRRTILRNFQDIEDFVNLAREKIAKGKKSKAMAEILILISLLCAKRSRISSGA